MRILSVAALPFPSPQGTQVLIGEIAEGLAARGHDVHLLCYGWGAEERAHGFAVHRLPSVGRGRSLRSGPSWSKLVLDALLARSARRLARDLGADVVLAHGHEALAAVSLPLRMGPRIVYHAHTRMGPELPTYFDGRLARAATRGAGSLADAGLPSRADAIVAVSPSLAAELGGLYLPPALRMPPPPAGPRDRDRLLYVGNLDRYQGLDVLLDALRALPPTVTLTIASASAPGPIAAAATARGIAGRVRFVPHGSLADVRALLARASVVVVPRAMPTGFPVKILEAMAAAAPLVVSRRAAHGLVDRVQARVVEDVDMAPALAALLADPTAARAMGLRGRAHVERAHDPGAAAALLEESLLGT